ncbi:MAG: class I SAM-dependent methyltransferase [Myxococcota bacterium]|nr:class I SAM-dependent methyltransferase [Myxococcota bacterium]
MSEDAQSGDGEGYPDSPYAHKESGRLRKRLSALKFSAAYSIWKRKIGRYSRPVDLPFSILEVGCGAGNFLQCLKTWYPHARLQAIDLDATVVGPCALRHGDVDFVRSRSEELPFEADSFDIISALQVIEHFPQPEAFLRESARVLRVGGLILLATPNTEGLAARWLGKKWPGIRPDHISLRSPEAWRHAVCQAGFESLSEGTTLLAGFRLLGRPPLSLPLQLVQAIFGWFPWARGESFMMVARRVED